MQFEGEKPGSPISVATHSLALGATCEQQELLDRSATVSLAAAGFLGKPADGVGHPLRPGPHPFVVGGRPVESEPRFHPDHQRIAGKLGIRDLVREARLNYRR